MLQGLCGWGVHFSNYIIIIYFLDISREKAVWIRVSDVVSNKLLKIHKIQFIQAMLYEYTTILWWTCFSFLNKKLFWFFFVSLDITFKKNFFKIIKFLLNIILQFNKTASLLINIWKKKSAMLTGVISCICNQHAEACRKPHRLWIMNS